MELQTFVELIGNVGFPIALSLILLQSILVRFTKQMDALEKRLAQLDKTINLMVKTFHSNVDKTPMLQEKKES
ncbi:hypothetical protein DFP94_103126 [Fontibacillus phaseoli]|uniref:YvrJ-like protein n=1 Tax=Fontibacillus phaseoli TaxID=1416533 RepID=A0A369BG65_9BACL|nr:YvrJ family protein [Fontibacillus phaseoli]RCX20401.1 hypothetical protein DFP94_103126 [Fontibacillus phaseoli]